MKFKYIYDSEMGKILFNILIEFDVPMKQLRLVQICLKSADLNFLADNFPIQNSLKQVETLLRMLLKFA
jgi:hypothetical protein